MSAGYKGYRFYVNGANPQNEKLINYLEAMPPNVRGSHITSVMRQYVENLEKPDVAECNEAILEILIGITKRLSVIENHMQNNEDVNDAANDTDAIWKIFHGNNE